MASGTILVADDDAAIRTVVNQALSRAGYTVRATGTASTLWRWASGGEGDIIITDVVMPDENAFDMIPRIRKSRPDMPIIVMSAQNTFMTAIKASELGAYEYLPKPFDLNELISTVGRALAVPRNRNASARDEDTEGMPLVGRSPAMQEIYRVLARLMQTDLTVMISGESGTGKELVAKALHDYGKRAKGPFVAINMAAIPRELIEAELFGHEKGAFTGAQTRNAGRFEQAEGGTLFLDEIGEISPAFQAKLLRVLQEGEFERVGGAKTLKVDVRIVCATNRNLEEAVAKNQFRADLYYRINVVTLLLPPLRQRVEDIPALARLFLERFSTENGRDLHFSEAAIETLTTCAFPGNVRELENCVRRTAALAPDDEIDDQDFACVHGDCLSRTLWKSHVGAPTPAPPAAPLPESHLFPIVAEGGESAPCPAPGACPVTHPHIGERERLVDAMERTGWVQAKAARLLGLTPRQIGYALRKHNVEMKRL